MSFIVIKNITYLHKLSNMCENHNISLFRMYFIVFILMFFIVMILRYLEFTWHWIFMYYIEICTRLVFLCKISSTQKKNVMKFKRETLISLDVQP